MAIYPESGWIRTTISGTSYECLRTFALPTAARNILRLDDRAKPTYCRVCMATVVKGMRHNVSSYVNRSSCLLCSLQGCLSGAAAKLRKATTNFVCLSVKLSVCQHGTSRLTLEGFLRNFILQNLLKICRKIQVLLNIWQEYLVLICKTCKCMIIYRLIILRLKNCREKQNTQFMFNNLPPPPPKIVQCITYGETFGKSHRWQYKTVHAHCMLGNSGYRHTQRICNTSVLPWKKWLSERGSGLRL